MKEIYNERIFQIFFVDLNKKDILTETITFHIIADFLKTPCRKQEGV